MNNLEALLFEAFTDPSLRVQFYTLLMNSEVFVVYMDSDSEIVDMRLKRGQSITLATLKKKDGRDIIPFFASEETLKKVVKGEAKYIIMNCKDFFEMIKGGEAVLNPLTTTSKEFSSGEIIALIDSVETVEKEEEVSENNLVEEIDGSRETPAREMISLHDSEPVKLIDGLKGYFSSEKRIKKGYIVVYDNPVLKKELKTLILINCTGGYEEIKQEILANAEKYNDSPYAVEVMKIEEGNYICEIVENRYSPFYMKKFLGIF